MDPSSTSVFPVLICDIFTDLHRPSSSWISSRGGTTRCGKRFTPCASSGFFFAGFRDHVGCDWGGYLVIFNAAHYQEENPGTESAFWQANKLLDYFELNYAYINVIASGLFFLGLHMVAKRQPDRFGVLILAFPILIINLAMSGIRQAIALGNPVSCVQRLR